MRLGLWVLAALFVGAFGAHFLLADRGYVLISFRDYVVEMSVPALVLLVALGYVAFRGAVRLVGSPRALGRAIAGRRVRRAGDKLTRGLIRMTEGDFGGGERLLTQGLKASDTPLVNYLMAARAAQLQGASDRRNEWLKIAYEELPDAETAVLLTQAELQFDAAEHERALATLQRILEKTPGHPAALALLARTHRALGDRRALAELLPDLARARLGRAELESLTVEAFDAAVETADLDRERLETLWGKLPPGLDRAPRLIRLRALALARLNDADKAEKELRAALKRDWRPETVRTYGEVVSSDPLKQLKQAEQWLKSHPEDGDLLLAAARLCMSNELWGKARSYLESSLALDPEPAAYAVYGRLLKHLGEDDGAALAFRSGLGLVHAEALAVPALDAPPRHPGPADPGTDEGDAGTRES